jgi:type VI secretion system protein ImpK
MKLAELCEPVFQYICRLNRSARKGGIHDDVQVRTEVTAILATLQANAKPDPALSAHLDKDRGEIYHVILFFVDFMIRNSKLSFASEWPNLAFEVGEMTGDQKLFDLLDLALADRSDAATERIGIYYTCLGLGFTGWFTGQPEYLRRKMVECSTRLSGKINADESAPVCPEAYLADSRTLFKPIRSSLVGMTIALVILLAAVLTINGYQYFKSSKELNGKLDGLAKSDGK